MVPGVGVMGEFEKSDLKRGEEATKLAGLIALSLTLIKVFAGLYSGSVVLLADALDSVFDLISSFTSWFGLKIAQKEPDENFPYGYYKAESIATLVVSVFIIYGSFDLMLKGYQRIFEMSYLNEPFLALGAAAVSLVSSYFLSRYLSRVGEKIHSSLLKATSQERKKDVLSSIIVFLAIVATYLELPYVEGLVTISISLLIFVMGLKTLKDALFALMDVSPSKEVEKKIQKTICDVPRVERVKDLRLRRSGPFIFGEVKIEIKKFVDVQKAHEISSEIEEKVCTVVPQIQNFTVHVEPYTPEAQVLVIPLKKEDEKSEVMKHFGRANYFLIADIEKGEVKNTHIEKNDFRQKKVRAGLAVANHLIETNVTAITTSRIGEIAFNTLKSNLVQVYETKGKKADDVIQNFLHGKMKIMEKPTHEKD